MVGYRPGVGGSGPTLSDARGVDKGEVSPSWGDLWEAFRGLAGAREVY